MKTKLYWASLLASAAMIAQANAGGHHGGGGGSGGTFAAPAAPSHAAASSFHSAGAGNIGAGRMIYSGHRFSPTGGRAISPLGSSARRIVANRSSSIGARQFTSRNIDGANHLNRSRNAANRSITNARRDAGAGQARRGNNLPNNWRNHVAAQHSASWHRDWDRSRDHNWHGHHCRFINGSWVIFDYGFYPWWPYGYPYDYYAYGYPYGYGYDSEDYDSDVYGGEEIYGGNANYDGFADSTVAAAQKRLALQGYYRAQIDGVLGQQTSNAIARFQRNHGLRVTGNLNTDTTAALGLQSVARN